MFEVNVMVFVWENGVFSSLPNSVKYLCNIICRFTSSNKHTILQQPFQERCLESPFVVGVMGYVNGL